MKITQNVANAQGAAAKTGFVCSNLNSSSTSKIAKNIVLVLIAGIILLANTGFSQTYDTLDVSTYGIQIIAPNVMLEQGETATFIVKVGSEGNQVTDGHGFDLHFLLSDDAVFPSSPDVSVSNSWLLDDTNFDTTTYAYEAEKEIRVQGNRTDGNTLDGYGEVFSVTLEAATGNVAAQSLIASGGGGLMIVENADWKVDNHAGLPGVDFSFQLFPNPCRHMLTLNWQGGSPSELCITDLSGNRIMRMDTQLLMTHQVNVEPLKTGMYLVIVTLEDGSKISKRFVKA